MSDAVLDTIDEAITEVESQLLNEFNRVRSVDDEADYCELDPRISSSLDEVVAQLWYQLGNSGDVHNLTLRTDRHESLEHRLMTVKKLIDAKITIGLLHDLHQEVIRTRRALNITDDTAERQLALLATCFRTMGDVRRVMQSAVTGKASFESRELSSVLPQATRPAPVAPGGGKSVFESRELSSSAPPVKSSKPETRSIARSPEEIRKKLANAGRQATGVSRFEARDLGGSAPADPPPRKAPPQISTGVAQSPEEIRRKLQSRQTASAGRASFTSRDIEPVLPQNVRTRGPTTDGQEKKDRQDQKKPVGRAVFESKDVSSAPPVGKKP